MFQDSADEEDYPCKEDPRFPVQTSCEFVQDITNHPCYNANREDFFLWVLLPTFIPFLTLSFESRSDIFYALVRYEAVLAILYLIELSFELTVLSLVKVSVDEHWNSNKEETEESEEDGGLYSKAYEVNLGISFFDGVFARILNLW